MLLDALLAATERLIITYTGNDERTNLARPPAVPVGELLDVVDRTVRTGAGPDAPAARDQVLVRHPLQPFDPRNFTRRRARRGTARGASTGRARRSAGAARRRGTARRRSSRPAARDRRRADRAGGRSSGSSSTRAGRSCASGSGSASASRSTRSRTRCRSSSTGSSSGASASGCSTGCSPARSSRTACGPRSRAARCRRRCSRHAGARPRAPIVTQLADAARQRRAGRVPRARSTSTCACRTAGRSPARSPGVRGDTIRRRYLLAGRAARPPRRVGAAARADRRAARAAVRGGRDRPGPPGRLPRRADDRRADRAARRRDGRRSRSWRSSSTSTTAACASRCRSPARPRPRTPRRRAAARTPTLRRQPQWETTFGYDKEDREPEHLLVYGGALPFAELLAEAPRADEQRRELAGGRGRPASGATRAGCGTGCSPTRS